MLKPVTIERFGGLKLSADPGEMGPNGAIDLLNVWFDRGAVKTAPTVATKVTATRAVTRLHTHDRVHLLASESDGTNVTLEAFGSFGTASVATTTFASAVRNPHSFATIGIPGAPEVTRTYAVRPSESGAKRWNSTAWADVATIPYGRCASPADSGTRLAIGGADGNESRVAFSDAGDPETFGADNYVDIAPGDGEDIVAFANWDNKLFAFKNTKFAVFYGVSTDSTGEPVFNYRMVDSGIGVGTKGLTGFAGDACVGPDGVYFVHENGVYRTRGDEPQLISGDITPLFNGYTAAETNVPSVSVNGGVDIAFVDSDLYLSMPNPALDKRVTLVLHDGQWTYLNVQENSTQAGSSNFADYIGMPWFATPGSTAIKRLEFSSGPSTALTCHYQSGYYDLGSPAEKKIRYVDLYGTGAPLLRMLTRGGRPSDLADIPGGFVTLGTSPAIARGRRARSVRGRQFAFRFSRSSGGFVVTRLDHLYLPPGSAA